MKITHIISILLIAIVTSCAVPQGERIERKRKKLKRISNAKLYKETVANYLDYENINLKKISISYEQEGKRQEFRGSARILKDSIIWLSISKLGIEGMRVKLTPNSVAFIDRLNKQYMITDYSYLNKKLNLALDYFLIQSILTNQLPEYRTKDDLPFYRNFKGDKTDSHYLFYSKKRRDKQYWKEQKGITGNKGSTLEILRITPDLMRLESLDIYDTQFLYDGSQQFIGFNLRYDNYKMYDEKYLFPEIITNTVRRETYNSSDRKSNKKEKIVLSIKIQKFTVNQENQNYPFSISSKYERINE